jgi:hypothetical protein
MPYTVLNSLIPTVGFPKGALNYWEGQGSSQSSTDEAIDAIGAQFAGVSLTT